MSRPRQVPLLRQLPEQGAVPAVPRSTRREGRRCVHQLHLYGQSVSVQPPDWLALPVSHVMDKANMQRSSEAGEAGEVEGGEVQGLEGQGPGGLDD